MDFDHRERGEERPQEADSFVFSPPKHLPEAQFHPLAQ